MNLNPVGARCRVYAPLRARVLQVLALSDPVVLRQALTGTGTLLLSWVRVDSGGGTVGRKALYLVVVYASLVVLAALYVIYTGVLHGGVQDSGEMTVVGAALLPVSGALALLFVVAVALLLQGSIIEFRAHDLGALRRSMRVMKFGMVPFFVVNFLHLLLVSWFLVGLTLGSGIVFFWFPIVITYLVFWPTSLYGFAYLMHLYRDRKLSAGFYAIHTLLHFLFVADVASTWILLMQTPRETVEPEPDATAAAATMSG